MRKVIVGLILLAVIVVGGFFIYQTYRDRQSAAQLENLQTVSASRGSLTATIGATGTVRSNQTAMLVWKTNGTVEEVTASLGDLVEEGFILAALQESSLPQNVILARSDLSTAQRSLDDLLNSGLARTQTTQAIYAARQAKIETERAMVRYDDDEYQDELDQAREDVVQARDDLTQAREDFEPYEDWDENNQTRRDYLEALEDAQREYDEAIRVLDLLRMEKEMAQANLDVANAELQEAERRYERIKDGADPAEVDVLEARIAAAEATLALARIEAPFAGTLTQVSIHPGDQVTTGQNAFRIDDLSHLLVDVRVSEVDINRIRTGQAVNLSFDAITAQEYRGVVTEVAQVGSTVQGVVEFIVTVELVDADENVRPGMTSAVNVVVNQLDNVLLVPNRAVRSFEGQRVVYILRSNNLERVPVTLGASSDTMSEVVSGNLQTGDVIVLNPPANFTNNGAPPFMRR